MRNPNLIWFRVKTGGGFTADRADLDGGRYALLTDDSDKRHGLAPDDTTNSFMLGLYSADDEQIGSVCGTREHCIEWLSKMSLIPAEDDDRRLRHVEFEGYELLLWDTNRRDKYGKYILGYAFGKRGESPPLFVGEDFGAPAIRPIDSDAVLRCLIGFLTLKPGDTDAEYFANYTEEQMAFARGDAENLSLWSMEDFSESFATFNNLDGWEP